MKRTGLVLAIASSLLAGPAGAEQDGIPALDHVFVIVLENQNIDQIIGNSNAPFINHLASTYNIATNYSAVWHPSLPNYLATIAGDFFGVSNNASCVINTPPGPWTFNAQTIGSQLEGIGKDWKDYQEDIPRAGSLLATWPGDASVGDLYAVKHNPFPYFQVHQTAAELSKMVPLTELFSDLAHNRLPALSYIVPNQCNDMHNLGNPRSPCAGFDDAKIIALGDLKTRELVNAITLSQMWERGRNVIFIIFDEGYKEPLSDLVVAIAVTSYGVKRIKDGTYYTHYSLLKTIEAGFRLPYLRHAADPDTKTMAPMLSQGHDHDDR
jgi:phospholipase C